VADDPTPTITEQVRKTLEEHQSALATAAEAVKNGVANYNACLAELPEVAAPIAARLRADYEASPASANPGALIAEFEGKYVAFYLAPVSREREPRDLVDHYAIYFAVCHGLDAGKRAAKDKVAVGLSLGYAEGLAQTRSQNFDRVEQFLSQFVGVSEDFFGVSAFAAKAPYQMFAAHELDGLGRENFGLLQVDLGVLVIGQLRSGCV
jgi:hypothetical protein